MRYLFGFLCVCALGVVPIGCGGDGGGVDSLVNPSTGCDSGSLDSSVTRVDISFDGSSRNTQRTRSGLTSNFSSPDTRSELLNPSY